MSADSELDRIDPEPAAVKLSTGYELQLQRLKTRQFFRLLRVLTRGLGPAMVQAGLDFKDDPEEFGKRLLSLLIMAIPEAEQQFIEFLQSMCLPPGLRQSRDGARLSKQDAADNQAMLAEMLDELNNPELEDLLTLAEAIVRQEAADIQGLGKRVGPLIELAKKTGQMNEPERQETMPGESSSPGLLPPLSTSSATSTDGPTSASSPSRSAGSASASRRRKPAGTATI